MLTACLQLRQVHRQEAGSRLIHACGSSALDSLPACAHGPSIGSACGRAALPELTQGCVQLPFNIFWSTMFTQDAIDELSDDLLMPTGDCLTFQGLGISAQKVS